MTRIFSTTTPTTRPAAEKLVVIDLDHALCRVNSHHHFSDRFFATAPAPSRLTYRLLTSALPRRVLTRWAGDDIRRLLSARLLSQHSEQDLEQFARRVFDPCFDELLNPPVCELLDLYRGREGFKLLIATAAPEFIASYFARRLGVGYLSSRISDGRYELDLTGRKIEAIAQHYPDAELHLMISDTCEDPDHRFAFFVLVRGQELFLRATPGDLTRWL